MFLADDIVLYPVKSILSLFREIYNAAVKDLADEADSIRAELAQLYLMLEAGTLAEADFDAREATLLDRLDALEATSDDDEDEDEEEEYEEDEDEDDDDEEEDLDDED